MTINVFYLAYFTYTVFPGATNSTLSIMCLYKFYNPRNVPVSLTEICQFLNDPNNIYQTHQVTRSVCQFGNWPWILNSSKFLSTSQKVMTPRSFPFGIWRTSGSRVLAGCNIYICLPERFYDTTDTFICGHN